MSTIQNLKYKFNNLDVFGKIIAINVVVFTIGLIFSSLLRFNLFTYFELPSGIMDFVFQPWSLITYGFLHSGPLHLVFNMLFLFYLSRALTNLFRPKMILNIYFLGIICGGLAYLAFSNLMEAAFFTGNGSFTNIPIQYKLSGFSVLLPVQIYSTDVIFTLIEL